MNVTGTNCPGSGELHAIEFSYGDAVTDLLLVPAFFAVTA
jgi:hypothetical protein